MFLFALGVLAIALGACGTAHAQDVEPAWCVASRDDVHVLAFAAFHEAGDSLADSAAIHHVLRQLAEHRGSGSLAAMARRYMPRASVGATRRSSWAQHLGPWCREAPTGYPHEQRSWSATEREWSRAWDAADAVLRGAYAMRCDGTFHDWGSPAVDSGRAARLGLIPVLCEVDGATTRNDLYARPSWRRRGR